MKIKTLLVCIGNGGVFYHGLSQMMNFMQKREEIGVLLVDDDETEDRNKTRQWGIAGAYKTDLAGHALVTLTHNHCVEGFNKRIGDDFTLRDCVVEGSKRLGKSNEMKVEKIMVIHSPDNHLCRVRVHKQCSDLVTMLKKPVMEITGGNTLTDGYAYGCLHTVEGMRGNYLGRHVDIQESANKELHREENPVACGSLGGSAEDEEEDKQSVNSNALTAFCIWSMAENMFSFGYSGEHKWKVQDDKSIKIWRKEVL